MGKNLSSEQVRAARALLRWEQKDLSKASGISLPTIKRLETQPGPLAAHQSSVDALQVSLESAGVEFIPDGDPSAPAGAGVRLRKPD